MTSKVDPLYPDSDGLWWTGERHHAGYITSKHLSSSIILSGYVSQHKPKPLILLILSELRWLEPWRTHSRITGELFSPHNHGDQIRLRFVAPILWSIVYFNTLLLCDFIHLILYIDTIWRSKCIVKLHDHTYSSPNLHPNEIWIILNHQTYTNYII